MKVHYVGWGRKFDEWRPISELSHFGFTNYIIRRDGLVEHQLRQISIAIQESLNGARRRDQSEEYGQCTHKIKSKVRYVHA